MCRAPDPPPPRPGGAARLPMGGGGTCQTCHSPCGGGTGPWGNGADEGAAACDWYVGCTRGFKKAVKTRRQYDPPPPPPCGHEVWN